LKSKQVRPQRRLLGGESAVIKRVAKMRWQTGHSPRPHP